MVPLTPTVRGALTVGAVAGGLKGLKPFTRPAPSSVSVRPAAQYFSTAPFKVQATPRR